MALDNFIPKSNTGRCKECRKYRGRLTCTIYPKWIPDKAMDEGCPDFEEKEEPASPEDKP